MSRVRIEVIRNLDPVRSKVCGSPKHWVSDMSKKHQMSADPIAAKRRIGRSIAALADWSGSPSRLISLNILTFSPNPLIYRTFPS